jgi:2-haloacid dehalogenase
MSELPCLVFDCNETLIDLETLVPTFERIFGSKDAMRLWFAQMILYSCALTLADSYVPFTDIGSAVMKMQAETQGIKLTDADRAELASKFASMPAHPEVPRALRRLKDAGFRLFTLTDTPAEINGRQLKQAGIVDLFERRFSVDDAVRRHKPSYDAYYSVEKALGIPPSNLCLIACHTWDTLGAVSAGWNAALILRKGNAPLEVGPQPAFIGRDLDDVADQLIARYAAEA